ncbi:hypothetical protein DPMN_140877 [Dreissena polymorpha]|uniref:Schwannomin interacting protein 1 C-terminal domain-containing protein n=1 Tax=Dreissena polymorpha TaxID=45954 RepID=A0A9D4GCB9_DREPO|nr:hypothetical protein DPMN_140877 [Dreissena polymorpha]
MPVVQNMAAINGHIEDLNLDFSDRNWESRTQNKPKAVFDFRVHESESDGSAASSESEFEHEDVDMDDEYFFDHRLDFGHYVPKVETVTDAVPKAETVTDAVPKVETVTVINKNNTTVTESKSIVLTSSLLPGVHTLHGSNSNSKKINLTDGETAGDATVPEFDRAFSVDENSNEKKRVSNGAICVEDVVDVNGTLSTLDGLTTAVEKFSAAARRNDREEIRKKLAMGGDDDSLDDNDDDDEVKLKRPSLQSRLHSGLQICFMNESPVDTDNEGASPRQHVPHDNDKLVSKVNGLVDSDNNLSSVTDLNNPSPPTTSIQSHSPPRLKADDKKADDFHSRQEQLQNEAKLALAQAGTMAHMQLEIEKQTQKKSPIAEMAGIPGLGERRRKKLSVRQLQQMNLAQTQVLYNDLQTQIESLNEDLVRLLMERDELHMEQDSMLVDIEDLTRRAEELADRANRDGKTKTCKMPSR